MTRGDDAAPPTAPHPPYPAWPERAAWGTATSLRAWQTAAMTAVLRRSSRATSSRSRRPGAGKTTFALSVAAELLGRRLVDRITIVAPTEHLKLQWAEAAARAGIPIDPAYSAGKGKTSQDYLGIAVTYAGVAVNPLALRIRTERFKTLVILDEVHHAGDALSWGEGVREAFEPAHRRLALTGTPFRSDVNPIPFVTYAPGDDGIPRSVADYTYGYAHALADHVVRPVLFMAYSGEMQWRTRAGDEIAARLGEPLTKDLTAQALRTALDPDGLVDPVGAGGRGQAALGGTPPRPRRRRPGDRLRPGLGPRLRQAAQGGHAARRRPWCSPTRSRRRSKIAEFTAGDGPLDGRGPDGVRGRRRTAARGRRLRHHHLDAAVLRPGRRPVRAGPRPRRDRVGLPAVGAQPAGLRLRDGGRSATTCSAAGSPTRTTSSPPRTTCSPRPRPARSASAELEALPFEALGSAGALRPGALRRRRVRPRGRGARRAPRRRWTSSASPGCSSPTRCASCWPSGRATGRKKQRPAATPTRTRSPEVTTHEQLAVLRRELNGLVAAWHHRTGQPHGVTHAALRKECGGPAAAVATRGAAAQADRPDPRVGGRASLT